MRDDPFSRRVTELNDAPYRARSYVLYWMQQSQRAQSNHALEYAVRLASARQVPVVVGFGLTGSYPEANARHLRFMLEGLRECEEALLRRGIPFVVRIGPPDAVALDLGSEAVAIVCDRGYLEHQRAWRFDVARTAGCRVVEVEGDLVVPVEEASGRKEYAARTIRPRIHARLSEFLVPLPEESVRHRADGTAPRGEDLSDVDSLIARLGVPAEVGGVTRFFRGGQREAERRLAVFLTERLSDYEERRSEPGLDVGSTLSPYLHFGQISELRIALDAGGLEYARSLDADGGRMSHQRGSVGLRTTGGEDAADERRTSSRDAFLEELLVRRGLSHNHVWYSRDYGGYLSVPEWARKALAEHAGDRREYVYTDAELEAGCTHDEYWNAAMREMTVTGFMHNYMRMYWGKKILEWSRTPEEAFERTLRLNNRWFLDGRDANSYANVGWTFGLHDRPWTRRPVFGTVRYMNANGLRRKFDMPGYLRKVERLTAGEAAG